MSNENNNNNVQTNSTNELAVRREKLKALVEAGKNPFEITKYDVDACSREIKEKVRMELKEHGIGHATLETESVGEVCDEEHCHVEPIANAGHHHHHHHHNHGHNHDHGHRDRHDHDHHSENHR